MICPCGMPLRRGGYLFAVSRLKESVAPTIADRRHARSSAVVMGRLSLFVSGFGMGTLDMSWARLGCMRVARDSWIICMSVMVHCLGSLPKMLRENCLWRLFDGVFLIALTKFFM